MDTKSWSSYKESDYTLEQWHKSCLIHQHDGAPSSKSQCKLPVRTPNGAINKNAIFSAAAALAGARTPINAIPEQKEKAARTLIRLYREIDQSPPTSLTKLAGLEMSDISELMHYGVKGMRWGVRRSDEELARSRSSKSGSVSGFADLDPTTQQAAIYATLITAQSFRNTIESGNARVAINKGKRFVQGKRDGVLYKTDKALAKKNMSENEIMSKVVKDINPDFGSFGANMNCRRCTLAYEMRRRGMDVKATKTTNARGQHGKGLAKATGSKTSYFQLGENKAYTQQNFTDPKDAAAKATFKALSKQPNGSRGEVGIGWAFGGGHSVAYEIVNNKPVIFDTQSGTKIKTPSDWQKAFQLDTREVTYTRLDNKTLNTDWLERWVKNND